MSDLTKVTQEFIAECQEDYVGLWSLVKRIRSAGFNKESEILEKTLSQLSPLLAQGKISAGQFENGKFHLWEDSSDGVIQRIKREWLELSRPLNIGDIVWFIANTGQ
jgi:hypothetical protein